LAYAKGELRIDTQRFLLLCFVPMELRTTRRESLCLLNVLLLMLLLPLPPLLLHRCVLPLRLHVCMRSLIA